MRHVLLFHNQEIRYFTAQASACVFYIFASAIRTTILASNSIMLSYFDVKKYGKVDFVVSGGVHTRLIEVKSGNDYKKHSALDKIRSVSEWTFRDSIVLCKGNLEAYDDVLYLPWYMMIFVCPDAPPQGLIYEVDLSALNGI